MTRIKASFLAVCLLMAGAGYAAAQDMANEEQPKPTRQSWSFNGVFGRFDQAQLQRGFQVYKEVCSNCHRLSIAFRTLEDKDGPGFTEDQVKTLAASYKVTNDEPDDTGKIFQRPGTPADIIPPPESFPNDQAAAAALGKAPPDMWLLAKSRKYERGFPYFIFDIFTGYQEIGADYIYAILNGYTHPDDPQWNLYYPGHKIAMPMPLQDGAVKYTDGSPQTLNQYAKDVAAFLSWAAEPTQTERKKIGFRALIFLVVLSVMMYMVKKRVWADAH
jgi:cytochrome c1